MTSSHFIQFTLDKPLPKKLLALPQIFNGCKAPLKRLGDIAANILSADGFKTLFEELVLKFYLYMGHIV